MQAPLKADGTGVVRTCAACGTRNRLVYGRLARHTRCGQCQADLPFADAPVEVATAAHFDAMVQAASLPVLVDFWADWCGPCRMVAPHVATIATRYAGRLLVAKVDTDAVPDLSARLGIRSIPTLAIFAGGTERTRTAGALTAAGLDDLLTRTLGAL